MAKRALANGSSSRNASSQYRVVSSQRTNHWPLAIDNCSPFGSGGEWESKIYRNETFPLTAG